MATCACWEPGKGGCNHGSTNRGFCQRQATVMIEDVTGSCEDVPVCGPCADYYTEGPWRLKVEKEWPFKPVPVVAMTRMQY